MVPPSLRKRRGAISKLIHHAVSIAITSLVCLIIFVSPAIARPRVVNNSDTVVLRGHVHPLARPEFDRGAVDPAIPMSSIILSLRIPSDKQAELDQLLAEQQDPTSPNYHHWLTPEEFGDRFGPAPEDIAAVTDWLISQGFTVDEVGKGRTWINFSGKVSHVEHAFHTQIHSYLVNGKLRQANATDPAIPRGLADLVSGPVSLNNFPHRAMQRGIRPVAPEETQPAFTSGSYHYLAPGDFAAIYNLNSLYAMGIDGSGQAIAITGRTNPPSINWANFRSDYGLPANPPQVIINGNDPGDLGIDEDGEADLDVEWSGAVAKKATIKFVVSASTHSTDGVDLSAQYIVNNNIAPVMSTSFGSCEAQMGSGNSFYNNLWAQAAAQGITSLVSTADSGAAGCDDPNNATAVHGLGVNGLASTPYNVAVGGTQFNENGGTYWSSSNASDGTSALGYIPEVSWNESGSVSGGAGLWATGGGASSLYAKPSWQVSPGVPADGKRDIPDVSLSASGHDGYRVRSAGTTYIFGGTSASSPSLAGIMALVVQKTGQRLGNANPRLYQLGNAQYGSGGAAVFHDTTSGNNTVPGLTGYSCTTGYDRVTGLGSVNAYNLIAAWNGVVPGFTLSAPAAAAAIQGGTATAAVSTTVAGGFNTAVALTASGMPSGVTATFSPASIASPGSGSSTLTLAAGAAAAVGTYPITVTGTGGGMTHTSSVSFTVTAAPDFTLAAPAMVSAAQGGSGMATISTSVGGGFNGTVALAASGLPTGASAGFNPAAIAAPGSGSSILTLTAGGATPAGAYSVSVTGTGGGKTHTATILFTITAVQVVTPAAGTGGMVTPGTPLTVAAGSTGTFTVIPVPGYHIASVTGCGGSLAGTVYTTAPVSGDCTVTALFARSDVVFDEFAYLQANPDVAAAVKSGIQSSGWAHYRDYGRSEGRPLTPDGYGSFRELPYLLANPDVAAAVKSGAQSSGWVHYLYYGKNENRQLEPAGFDNFSEEAYLAANPDVAAAVKSGVWSSGWAHYRDTGKMEGRSLSPVDYGSFSEEAYLLANPDVAQAVKNGYVSSGWVHYLYYGKNEGRSVAPAGYVIYNESAYLAANPDVAAAVKSGIFDSGWSHYMSYGIHEGRALAPEGYAPFNESAYLAANPDVATAVKAGWMPNGWIHYLYYGKGEGRPLNPAGYGSFNESEYLAANPDLLPALQSGAIISGWQHYSIWGMNEGRKLLP